MPKTINTPRGAFRFVDREQLRRKDQSRRYVRPKVLGLAAVPPPLPIDWTGGNTVSLPVDGNNQYGDCYYAAIAHMVQVWNFANGRPVSFDTAAIVRRYLQLSGGDNGLGDGQVFPEFTSGIVGPNGPHKILDSLLIDVHDQAAIQEAIWAFGGALYTASLLNTWEANMNPGATWQNDGYPDPRAGHAMLLAGVNADGSYKDETWGFNPPIKLTNAGMLASNPEIIVCFSLEWFNEKGIAPNGKSYAELAALWQARGGKVLPPSPFAPIPDPPKPDPVDPPTPSIFPSYSDITTKHLPFIGDVLVKTSAAKVGIPSGLLGWYRFVRALDRTIADFTAGASSDVLGADIASLRNAWGNESDSLRATFPFAKLFEDVDTLLTDFEAGNWVAIIANLRAIEADFGLSAEACGSAEAPLGLRAFGHAIKWRCQRKAHRDVKSYAAFQAAWIAAEKAGKLSPQIIAARAIGDGTIIQAIIADVKAFITWIEDPVHEAEIEQWIEWIMALLAAFGL